jgi:hypothetical protein
LLHLDMEQILSNQIKLHQMGTARASENQRSFKDVCQKPRTGRTCKVKPRPNKPGLNGLPRIILVSDMGIILSHGYSPDHLKSEITDVVSPAKGKRHWRLWTTRNIHTQ